MYCLLDRNDPRFKNEAFAYLNNLRNEGAHDLAWEISPQFHLNWEKFLNDYTPLVLYENSDFKGDSSAFALYQKEVAQPSEQFLGVKEYIQIRNIQVRFGASRYWKNPGLIFQAIENAAQAQSKNNSLFYMHFSRPTQCFGRQTWDAVKQLMQDCQYTVLRSIRSIELSTCERQTCDNFSVQAYSNGKSKDPFIDSNDLLIQFSRSTDSHEFTASISTTGVMLNPGLEYKETFCINYLQGIENPEDTKFCIDVLKKYFDSIRKWKYNLVYIDYFDDQDREFGEVCSMTFKRSL